MPLRLVFISVLLGVLCAQAAPSVAQGFRGIQVDGTQFRVVRSDGSILTSRDLTGAVLTLQTAERRVRIRIDAVEPDPDDKSGEILLHSFSAQQADGSWQPLCLPGPDGRQQGFPLEGRSAPDASFHISPGSIELICVSGAQGKCVRFGYKPWKQADGVSMLDMYNACTRMVRGDYCGNGDATTRDGMRIDVYDKLGIQQPENDTTDAFEAGWSPEGAVCVNHVRVKENASLPSIAATCPRLRNRVGEMCTQERATALGALLFNRSRP